jgi:hypothetical protein
MQICLVHQLSCKDEILEKFLLPFWKSACIKFHFDALQTIETRLNIYVARICRRFLAANQPDGKHRKENREENIFWYIVSVHVQRKIMATSDIILAIVFGFMSLISFVGTILCFRKALKVSGERDGDLKMFLWAVGSLIGLIIAGMSAAYILLPIIFNYSRNL